ncbi:hypothetical protein ABJ851_002485 [Shigella flexneri]|nr:hypothetical protein [Escherichia coli]
MQLIFKGNNSRRIRLVSFVLFLQMSTSLCAKNPCEGLKGDLLETQLIPLQKNIARQLNSEMDGVVEVNNLQILNYSVLGKWSLIYVFTGVSDEAISIYKDNIFKTDYVTLFSGGVSVEDDMNQ